MAYDFFLSYACQDNEPMIPGARDSEWVTTFHAVLRGKLQFYLGREADIFFDRSDLSGNSALTPEIQAALDQSHLFVAISSPTYYRRPWCKLERARFIQRLGPNPAAAKRVFVIHTTEVDPLIRPLTWQSEFFPDLRGYFFYREDKATGGGRRMLGAPVLSEPVADASAYYLEINRLAQDMAERIRELEGGAPQPTGAPARTEGDAVFLAENAFRSHAEREEVRAALRDAGFEVRPAASLAGKPAELLSQAMQDALAFVQIVSPMLVEVPGAQGGTYDQAQLEAARAAGLPVFRWRAPDLDIETAEKMFPNYRAFACGADARQQLLATFKEDLVTELKELAAKRRVKQAVQGEDRLVLIAGDAADLASHATTLTQRLQNHAIGHYITDAPAQEIEAEDVKGLLVLYGASSAEWVRDRLRVIRSLPKTRQRELRVGVYFCAPPPDLGQRQLLFDMPSFKKIRWDDQRSLDEFAQAVVE
jgi:hypothetical protein